MAPRGRRSKVGLTRMHAALDAMRPMGFTPAVVRKSVKNLLKVYGEEGWCFIEETSYKLLIETMLDQPLAVDLERDPENMLEEGGSQGAHETLEFELEPENMLEEGGSQWALEKQELVLESSDKMVVVPGEKTHSLDFPEPGTQCKGSEIKLEGGREKECLEIVKAKPMILEDYSPRSDVGLPLAYASPSSSSNPKSQAIKPCFGWISDDEEDELLQMTPAKGLDD